MAPQRIFLLKHTQKQAKDHLNCIFSHFFSSKMKTLEGVKLLDNSKIIDYKMAPQAIFLV